MDPSCLLLKLLLFFIILTTRASLQCETCSGIGINCSGPMEPCKTGEETCAISYIVDIIERESLRDFRKGCGNVHMCTSPPLQLVMGPSRIIRSNWTCCKGEECKTASVSLPPVETRTNENLCPRCHEWSESCKAQTLECTGEDLKSQRLGSMNRTMMGCTNNNVCATIESKPFRFWYGYGDIQKAQCETTYSKGSRPNNVFLTPFSALLLMKIFM